MTKQESANQILLDRGSGLLARTARKGKKNAVPGTLASEFITHNEQGLVRVFVAGGSRPGLTKVYEKQAFLLGQEIGRKQYRLDFGLSSKGIMGAVARGVLNAWVELGRSHKIPIHGVTTAEYLALYQSDEILDQVSDIIVAHTLEERKKQLLAADFVIFAPGGVGTLDELVYDCVAMQDGFLPFKPFILFNVEGFFHHLLEFLKDIHLKGFADPIPFIVVDDSFEAGVAFDMMAALYRKTNDREQGFVAVQNLIHDLPYVIEEKRRYPDKSIALILADMAAVSEHGTLVQKKRLKKAVETAYLNKEIERMYDRLGKTGRDTTVVSRKLTRLKRRRGVQ